MKIFVLSTPAARQNCLAYVQRCTDGMTVEIRETKAKRSSQANRRYRAILNQISEDGWIEGRQYSADIWHEFMKRRFIGTLDLPAGGSMAESSASLNTAAFESGFALKAIS